MWGTARNIADASTYAKGSLNSGQITDRQEEARLDKAMKDMFEFDHTRMLLLYRLPTEAVVSTKRPDWGRLIRNKPEFPNSGCVLKHARLIFTYISDARFIG